MTTVQPVPQRPSPPVITIVGASGDLGSRIARELLQRNARVRAITRSGSAAPRLEQLRELGAEVASVDFDDETALARSLEGSSVVISCVAGLREAIVVAQEKLLDAAVRAGVPRFIPSDFSIDFARLPRGSNRNLDLRSEFRRRLDDAPIKSTSILNGAFMDMLTGTAPFILFRIRCVLCWGDPDQLMDWTTIADTARYTAAAALDPTTPRELRIAGEEISARGLATVMSDLTGRPHRILRPGGLAVLGGMIRLTRALTPERGALYPPWQGMQYMHNMYSGLPKFDQLDNDRYRMQWTQVRDLLSEHLARRRSDPATRPTGPR